MLHRSDVKVRRQERKCGSRWGPAAGIWGRMG